ncbi:MAG TPA: T9SS type A sorting domain-containing protein [Ignavibacteria bacterium]|nr:T9SS type A sorting domain-containing protein [Ignavibacteria bacterium]
MKKFILTAVLLFSVTSGIFSQTLTQSNFQGNIVQQYIGSGGTTRLPYVFRATVSGLSANSKYRYYTQVCRYTDLGGTNSGAGNPIFIHGTDFRYSTGASVSNPTGYDSLMTDASGNYTGWFGFVNTGNARFTAGNYISPTITLDSMGNGVVKYRFALNDSINVLQFSDSATVRSGTGIYGISTASPKNIVSLYDNINGTGRPLSMVFVESDGIDTTVMSSLVQYYKDSVDSRNGRWGNIIPNLLPGGVKRINVLHLSNAAIANFSTDADGIWPSGTNTVNPNGGSANPLRLTIQDAPLSIKNTVGIPDNFSLKQNYPNPFNPTTNIEFAISGSGFVSLKIYDILGKEVAALVNENLNSGTYNYRFDASALNSGVYFYSLNYTGDKGVNFSDRKKLVIVK